VACQILGEAWLTPNKVDAAVETLRLALAMPAPDQGERRKAWTSCLLGAALAATGKFEEAERLLLASHAQLTREADSPLSESHHRVVRSLEQLVRLYEQTGKPAEATRWKQQLDAARERGQKPKPG
jgi:hypothetical protein